MQARKKKRLHDQAVNSFQKAPAKKIKNHVTPSSGALARPRDTCLKKKYNRGQGTRAFFFFKHVSLEACALQWQQKARAFKIFNLVALTAIFFWAYPLRAKKKLLRLLPLTLWVIVALRFFCHPLGDKTSTSSTQAPAKKIKNHVTPSSGDKLRVP